MFKRIRLWLNDVTFSDPIEQQQAILVQLILLLLLISGLVGLSLNVLTVTTPLQIGFTVGLYGLLLFAALTGLLLLRRGRFNGAVLCAVLSLHVILGVSLIGSGIKSYVTAPVLVALTLPLALAGLLVTRRVLLLSLGLTIVTLVTTAALEYAGSPIVGMIPQSADPTVPILTTAILDLSALAFFFDRFSNSLRNALTTALAREHELEHIRTAQEATIDERTTSLQTALQAVEQREAHLTSLVAELQTSREAIRELSAPIIPIIEGVLVAPLVGALDTARAATLTSNVLAAVEQEHAHHVIFDITGVPVVDTQVAQVLVQTASAAQLLGARVILVGIRPEVAQTITTLGITFTTIRTYSSLREAVEMLMAEQRIVTNRKATPAKQQAVRSA